MVTPRIKALLTGAIYLPFWLVATFIAAYALAGLLVAAHVMEPVLGLEWLQAHTRSPLAQALSVGFILAFAWPALFTIAIGIMFVGSIAAAVVVHYWLKYRSSNRGDETAQQLDFDQPKQVAAFVASRNLTAAPPVTKSMQLSAFLRGGAERIEPVGAGMLHDRPFSWYTGQNGHVFVVDLGDKAYTHCLVRTNLLPETEGFLSGKINHTVPMRLEGDFGNYFTVHAAQHDESNVRFILTPDVMLSILENLPLAYIELLDTTMYVLVPEIATKEAADETLAALVPVSRQIIEQRPTTSHETGTGFRSDRWSIGKLADKSTITLLTLFGLMFIALLAGSLIAELGAIGDAVSKLFFGIAILLVILQFILASFMAYSFVFHTAVHYFRRTALTFKAGLLIKHYRLRYARNV